MGAMGTWYLAARHQDRAFRDPPPWQGTGIPAAAKCHKEVGWAVFHTEHRHQAELLAKPHQLEVNAAKHRVQPNVKRKPAKAPPRRTDDAQNLH